jgi:outer membrane protein insertion porin family
VKLESGNLLKSQVNTSIVMDRRDNPILTRTGQRISLAPYVAGGPLGGDEQIYGFDLEASQYFHFPGDLILLFNGEMATVDVWDKPESKTIFVDQVGNIYNAQPMTPATVSEEIRGVPIYDRLYLGGSNNLRGFNFRDVSPKDNNRDSIGGQSMARWTTELTFPIVLKTRGAFFYDAGFVNVDPWDFVPETQDTPRGVRAQLGQPSASPTPIPPKTGPRNTYNSLAQDVGFGLRLDLPIGPLRLDYGYPLETAGNSKRGHINFSVGYQF